MPGPWAPHHFLPSPFSKCQGKLMVIVPDKQSLGDRSLGLLKLHFREGELHRGTQQGSHGHLHVRCSAASLYRKDCQVCLQLDDLTASVAAPVSDCADVSVTRESPEGSPLSSLKRPMPRQLWSLVFTGEALSLQQPGYQIGCSLRLDCENWAPLMEEGGEQEERREPRFKRTHHPSHAAPSILHVRMQTDFPRSCYLRMT